jgi:hypothetical protein
VWPTKLHHGRCCKVELQIKCLINKCHTADLDNPPFVPRFCPSSPFVPSQNTDCGSKSQEVPAGWSGSQEEELCNFCYSLSIIQAIKSRGIRWAWHCSTRDVRENYVQNSVLEKLEVGGPLWRHRRTGKDNIKTHVQEIWIGFNWLRTEHTIWLL